MEPAKEYVAVTMEFKDKGRITVHYDIMTSYHLPTLARLIHGDSENEWQRGIMFGSSDEDKAIIYDNGEEIDITNELKEMVHQAAITECLMEDF